MSFYDELTDLLQELELLAAEEELTAE